MPRTCTNTIRSSSPESQPNEPQHPRLTDETLQAIRDPPTLGLVRAVQLDADRVRKERDELQQEVEALRGQTQKKKRRTIRTPSTRVEAELRVVDKIKNGGKQFVVFYRPWVDPDILELSLPNDPDDMEQFESLLESFLDDIGMPSAAVSGQNLSDAERSRASQRVKKFETMEQELTPWEYATALPSPIHRRHNEDDVIKTFINAGSEHRSNLVYRIRKLVPTSIFAPFNFDHTLISLIGTDEARACGRFQELLGYDADQNTYQVLPPCLYANGDASKPRGLLRSRPAMLTLRTILFGPEAIRQAATMNMGGSRGSVSKKSLGISWGTNSLLPGAIAFACILVMYTLSPDTEFIECGKKSGITYLTSFREIKLLVLRLQYSAFGRETLDLWEREVFEGTASAPVEVATSTLSGLDQAWVFLQEEEDASNRVYKDHLEEEEQPHQHDTNSLEGDGKTDDETVEKHSGDDASLEKENQEPHRTRHTTKSPSPMNGSPEKDPSPPPPSQPRTRARAPLANSGKANSAINVTSRRRRLV